MARSTCLLLLTCLQASDTKRECPDRETTEDWDKEIGEDVKEECSKFGAVNHIYVDRNSKAS